MFKIEGLFLDDLSSNHLASIKSLCVYLDEFLGANTSSELLFSMQRHIYEIHQIGADALSKSAMQDRSFACKKRCDSCCHATDVDITPLEAFYLADLIRSESIKNPVTIKPRLQASAPCPLLKDGLCTVYDARPLSCRYIMSTDLAACIKRRETLIGGAKLPAPFSNFRTSIAAASFIIFKARGLDARWLVLDKTIEQIVNNEQALDNWLTGQKLSDDIVADEPAGRFKELILAVGAFA